MEGLSRGDGNVLSSARLQDDSQLHCVLLTLDTVTKEEEQTHQHSSVSTLLHWVIFNRGWQIIYTIEVFSIYWLKFLILLKSIRSMKDLLFALSGLVNYLCKS